MIGGGAVPPKHSNDGIACNRSMPHEGQGTSSYLITLWNRLLKLPRGDSLLTLVSFNVFRAFLSNVRLLNFNYAMLNDETSVSPFLNRYYQQNLPLNFAPTAAQVIIRHHPVFDVFPDPQFRDAILLSSNASEGADICWDLVGMPSLSHDLPIGLLVWGEAHLVRSWEVSELFFDKHEVLLRSCTDLIESTNSWRASRGEEPLSFKAMH